MWAFYQESAMRVIKGTMLDFLQLAAEDQRLARELDALAARFGFVFTDDVEEIAPFDLDTEPLFYSDDGDTEDLGSATFLERGFPNSERLH
jgi:hypothetical protein